MGSIVPLLLALLVLELHGGQTPSSGPLWIPAAWAGGLIVGWMVVAEIASRLLVRSGSRIWLRRWELIAHGLCLGILVWLCREQNWSMTIPSHAAALAPWLLCQLVLWGTLAPAVSVITGTSWTRSGLILHHLRFELAPALIILPILDLCELIGERTGMMQWFAGPDGFLLGLLGTGFTLFIFLALLPSVIALLWGAQTLPNDTLRQALEQDCVKAGMPDVRLRVWSSPGGEVHNAVALGVMPGLRWVLISDDLIRDLSTEQLRAVVAHELGHHRHRHLVTYVWFALVTNIMLWASMSALVGTVDANGHLLSQQLFNLLGEDHRGLLFEIPGINQVHADVVLYGVGALLVLLVWRVLFGHLSRACEREADVHGAWLTSPAAMAGALVSVARLSGTPETAPSWRHRSIHDRALFLRELSREPHLAPLSHHQVNSMRLGMLTALALILMLGAGYWLDPVRRSTNTADPGGEINKLVATDSDLGQALTTADAGNPGPLISWLTRAQPLERQILATLTLRQLDLSGEISKNGTRLPPDDRFGWRHRHRLAALSAVPMEDEKNLGLNIDNALAYSLIAGTTEPSPQGVTMARNLLPRLQAAMSVSPHDGVLDTIGCIHFVLGEWLAARGAWDQALQLLRASPHFRGAAANTNERLYRSRLEAAQYNLAASQGGRGGPYLPLPLGFGDNAGTESMHEQAH